MDATLLPCGRIPPSDASVPPRSASSVGGPPPPRSRATPAVRVSKFGALSLKAFLPSHGRRRAERHRRRSCGGGARAYRENANPVFKFLSRVQGALPVVGLISRLASPEGGVGADRIRFDEFCTRVGRRCSREESRTFYEIAERHGKSAKPPFVLIWCWAAAVGAGLLRSEDLLMGASRLRVSKDIQYEVENFDLLMDEATKKRAKSGSKVPDVSMESRAEKALEAICKCCTGTTNVAEEDAPLFAMILKAVFPTADKEEIDSIVASRLFDPSTSPSSDQSENEIDDDVEEDEDEENEGKPDDEEVAGSQQESVVHEVSQ